MKPLTNTLKFLESNTAKNMIIVFGVALSIFTITSFESVSNTNKDLSAKEEVKQPNTEEMEVVGETDSEKPSVINSKKSKTHHNFIASYFLQESSIKRERKTADSEVGTVGKILHIHKMLMSAVVSSF